MFRIAAKRFNSTAVAKPSPIARVTGMVEPIIYYTRVTANFLGQVASHSKLTSLPDLGNATQGISGFIGAFGNGAWQKVTIGQVGELAGAGVKIAGFFLVGEMIGKGSIIGYQIPGTDNALKEGGGH